MAGTSMTTHAALSGSIRGIERASLRARAPVRLTTRLPRRGMVDGSTGSRSRTVVRPGRWTATATDPRADSSSSKPSPAAADEDVRAKDDETSARSRSPFPIEDFERASFPTAARFLWASRGLTQGTGLKPLDVSQNWLEQDGYTDDGAEGADDGNNTWIQEMRRRHELIDSERGCVVWDPSASAAAETLLPMMCDWLCARQPTRYVRAPDGGVTVPSLDGWSTGPLDRLEGIDAMKTCAKLVQEELCLVREETLEDLWLSCGDDGDVDDGPDDAITRWCDYGEHDGAGGETARHTFEAGVVCFSFDPRKRHRKTLAEVHAPVPGYERKMRDAVARVFTKLKTDKPLWRANWVLQNSGEVVSTDLEWHPTNVAIGGVANRAEAAATRAATTGIDPDTSTFRDERHTGYMDPLRELPRTAEEAGSRMHLRVEYETIRRLPGEDRDVNRWILFTVRTHLDRIDSFDASTAEALHDAIRGTDPDELEYKSLGDDKLAAVVTEFLAERAGLPMETQTETETDPANNQDETVYEGLSLKDPANSAVPSGGRCPFFKGAEGGAESAKAKGEANGEAAADDNSKKSKAEVATAVNEDEEDEETKRIDVATRAGIEPWTSASLGVAAANTPPASWYNDSSGTVPTAEQRNVFGRGWTWAGRVDQVANNGNYLVGATGTVKYVVVRGEDGVLRAFHNACRHHAMEVASAPWDVPGSNPSSADMSTKCESTPSATCFQCPYHGWTYDLEGSLIRATKIGGVENFVVADNGLKPIRVATWGPFVMLNLNAGDDDDDDDDVSSIPGPGEWMGNDVSARISTSWFDDPSSMKFVTRRTYSLNCNWKVFADNYLDGGYHVPFAHPTLVADGVDMKKYETTIYGEYVSIQTVNGGEFTRDKNKNTVDENIIPSSSVVAPAERQGKRSRRSEAKRKKAAMNKTARRKAANATGTDGTNNENNGDSSLTQLTRLGDSALYAFVYPNLMINRYGPWMDTNVVTPTGPNTCVVHFDYFLEADLLPRVDDKFVEESLAASGRVQTETTWLCEKVQGGMESPGYGSGRYAPAMEAAMFHFHDRLWRDLTAAEE